MKKIVFMILLLPSKILFSQTAAELLQNKLNAIRSMSASFNQVVKVKRRLVSTASGTMALQRPGHFRWQTRSPLEQLLVADGSTIWVYDKDLEQVVVKKQAKGLGGTAALFLSGYDDSVARDFEVSQRSSGASMTFDLKAKSSRANFQAVQLSFTNQQLKRLEMFDQLGQTTSITFSRIQLNPKLSPSTFIFKTPKGVDFVRQ